MTDLKLRTSPLPHRFPSPRLNPSGILPRCLPMIVVLKPNLELSEVEKAIAEVAKLGYEPRPIHGKVQTVIAAIGDENTHQSLETLASWPQVEHVHRVQKRYKLTSREAKKGKDTIVKIRGQEI